MPISGSARRGRGGAPIRKIQLALQRKRGRWGDSRLVGQGGLHAGDEDAPPRPGGTPAGQLAAYREVKPLPIEPGQPFGAPVTAVQHHHQRCNEVFVAEWVSAAASNTGRAHSSRSHNC